MKPLIKKMQTDTEVKMKESKDFIADRCFIVISSPKDKAARVAIPKPPLKYPPYMLTTVTPRNWGRLLRFSFFSVLLGLKIKSKVANKINQGNKDINILSSVLINNRAPRIELELAITVKVIRCLGFKSR